MSELDRTTTSASNVQNLDLRGVSKQAAGKLRSLAGRTQAIAGNHGLADDTNQLVGDAFAEIFAIVASTRIETDSVQSGTEDSIEATSTAVVSESSESEQDESDQESSETSNRQVDGELTDDLIDHGLAEPETIQPIVETDETASGLEHVAAELGDQNAVDDGDEVNESLAVVQVQQVESAVDETVARTRSKRRNSDEKSETNVTQVQSNPLATNDSKKVIAATTDQQVDTSSHSDQPSALATTEGAGIFGGEEQGRDSKRDSRRQHFGIKDPAVSTKSKGVPEQVASSNPSQDDSISQSDNSLAGKEASVSRSGDHGKAAASIASGAAVHRAGVPSIAGGSAAASRSVTPVTASQANQSVTGVGGLEASSESQRQREDSSRPADQKANTTTADKASNKAETLNRIKLIQRVSKAFNHFGPEGGTVRLRLAPAELGSVRLEMQIHQKKVNARVVAETQSAETALREHLGDLRGRLESLGMQVESLEVTRDQGSSDSGTSNDFNQSQERTQQFADQRESSRRGRPDRRRSDADESVNGSPSIETSIPALAGDHGWSPGSGVDLHV